MALDKAFPPTVPKYVAAPWPIPLANLESPKAEVIPFPMELTTPPVIIIYFVRQIHS